MINTKYYFGMAITALVLILLPSGRTTTTFPTSDSVDSEVASQGVIAYVVGSYASPVAGKHGYLEVIDVSDPSNPIYKGHRNTPGKALDVAVAGDYTYVYVADDEDGLRVINVSDPENIFEEGACDTPGNAKGVAVAGSYAYIADGHGGLRVIDVSDPANPRKKGSYDEWYFGDDAVDVAVAGNYAFLAHNDTGLIEVVISLHAFDVSDPNDPILKDSLQWTTYLWEWKVFGVVVAKKHAYLAHGVKDLTIIDISDPSNLIEKGRCDMPGYAYDVALAGDYAYIAAWHEGLQVIDVGDPANPARVGSCELEGDVVGVAVAGNYAYLVDDRYGYLHIVDISDPHNPTLVSSYDTLGLAKGVAVVFPYMTVLDITASEFAPDHGDFLSFRVRVRNDGAAGCRYIGGAVKYPDGSYCNTEGKEICLGAGEIGFVNLNWTVPSDAPEGWYGFKASSWDNCWSGCEAIPCYLDGCCKGKQEEYERFPAFGVGLYNVYLPIILKNR